MKRIFIVTGLFISLHAFAQDSTMNNLTKDMENKEGTGNRPVKIFNSDKAINANTTELVAKGKMDFKVTHNFGNIDGKGGVFGKFLGLDDIADVRIGFNIGLTDRLNFNFARVKGFQKPQKLLEFALKYQLMNQLENDPSHPVAIALFANTVISYMAKDTSTNQPGSFKNFGDRTSQVFQVIIAKKIGRISLQLNPTYVNINHVVSYDDKNMFAIGGAIRFPVSRNFNFLIDYFHPFRSKSSKDSFERLFDKKFYDPLGIGVEIITAGHVFHLNFSNTTEILENKFIPHTETSWTKGQSRWCFTISRAFVLWREKR
jgi:hypothetical protein